MNDMLKTVLIAVISSAVVSIGAVVVKETYFTQKQEVVTVDLQKVITEEIQGNLKGAVSDEQREQRARLFANSLESALTQVSAEGKHIVMVAPAVIRGGVDVTDQVKAAIEADLKKAMTK